MTEEATTLQLPAIPAIPDDECGPAMLALSSRHRSYAYARVFDGLCQADAYLAAGYQSKSRDLAKPNAWRIEHREDVQAAIGELSRKLMRAEGPRSIRVLAQVRDDPKAANRDRVKAAEAILDRCGLGSISQHHHLVEHKVQLTEAQQDRRILELAKELGLGEQEARKLLVAPPDVIDAEFEELPRTPEQEAERAKRREYKARSRELKSMNPEERIAYEADRRRLQSENAKAEYAEADAQRKAEEAKPQIDLDACFSSPVDQHSEEYSTDGIEDLLQ